MHRHDTKEPYVGASEVSVFILFLLGVCEWGREIAFFETQRQLELVANSARIAVVDRGGTISTRHR
jgi:hypothetical protein